MRRFRGRLHRMILHGPLDYQMPLHMALDICIRDYLAPAGAACGGMVLMYWTMELICAGSK
jgi:hypothetical protein